MVGQILNWSAVKPTGATGQTDLMGIGARRSTGFPCIVTVDRNRRVWAWTLSWISLFALALLLPGCEENPVCCSSDYRAPAPPQGIQSRTGDSRVELSWLPNTEEDLEGYTVYRSSSDRGRFQEIATLGWRATHYSDRSVSNGVTYHYAMTAFDQDGNESDLSSDSVFDTPRPEGRGLRLANARLEPDRSGYDFSRDRVVDYREAEADVYFWATEEDGPWMIATERSAEDYTDLQDAGYVPLEDIDWAPEEGWSPTGEVPLIPGHSYVVWTWDNHFAKFRVDQVNREEVVLDWAYQPDGGNPELFAGAGPRPSRVGAVLRVHEKGLPRKAAP